MSEHERIVQVLGIAGSLRKGSFNQLLLELARDSSPPGLKLTIYDDLGAIPLFNEDLEDDDLTPPPSVQKLRNAIASSDAVLIATPEYNQSMPGVVKNMIDWVSRSAPESAFAGKPVALCGITTGEWGTRLSQAALRQTLFATGARLVPLHLYLRRAGRPTLDREAPDAALASQVQTFMAALGKELQSMRN